MFEKLKMPFKGNPKKEEKKDFLKEEQKTDDPELISIQTAYRNGEIKEGELSQEQVDRLTQLYDAQITELKKAIADRKERIEKHKKKLKKRN